MLGNPLSSKPPPEGGRRYVALVRPKVGQPVSGIVHSSVVTGLDTHFIDGDTHPCLGVGEECIGHARGIPVRWKGYLFGVSDQLHKPCLFEVTAECVRASIQLRDPACNLRGAHLTLTRCGPNVNSASRAMVRLEAQPRNLPSEEPDVIRWLCVIWGVEDPRDAILRTEGGHDD